MSAWPWSSRWAAAGQLLLESPMMGATPFLECRMAAPRAAPWAGFVLLPSKAIQRSAQPLTTASV